MTTTLAGKVALITGGSRGLGAAIAEGNNEGFLSFCADDMAWSN